MLTWLAGQRARRHFTPAAVPVEVVRSILEVARWTGSARNGQPWRFAVVTDARLQHRLSRLGQYAQHLASAPVVIALLTEPDAGGTDTEFDLGRLCQNITLAAAAQALGSCPATLHPTDNARAAAGLLGFEEPWQCRHAVSLGYPASPPSGRAAITTGRRPLEELVVELRPRRSDVPDHP